MRWLIALMLGLFVTGGDAEAQSFKPRSGAKTGTKAKKANVSKKAAPKKAAPKKASNQAKKGSREARLDELEDKNEDADDYVLITDD